MFNAKNSIVHLPDDTMHYIRFGRGAKKLVILPGLGDGLTTVKGTALPMSIMYRIFAKDFTVYMFSRRNALCEGCTTWDMAHDLKSAFDALGIEKADLMGVSMGGMIAQHFAADYPEKVGKLVLATTCFEPNPLLNESILEWIDLAERGNHAAFMLSTMQRMYSEAYCRKNRWMTPVMGRLTKPRSYHRFFIQAKACLAHNAQYRLSRITAPTLIIGGERDRALGGEPSRQMAARIRGAQLKMYPEWGHALYEEAKDFNQLVLDFLNCPEESA